MERAVKEDEHRARSRAKLAKATQPGAGRLPRHHRRERSPRCAASSARRREYQVVKNTLLKQRGQGHAPMEGLDEAPRRPDRHRLLATRTRRRPPRSPPRSPRARRSSRSRAASSTARPSTQGRRGRWPSCPARTSSALRLALHFWSPAPQNFARASCRPPPQQMLRVRAGARAEQLGCRTEGERHE